MANGRPLTYDIVDNLTTALIKQLTPNQNTTSHSGQPHKLVLEPSQVATIVRFTGFSYYSIIVIAVLGVVLNVNVVRQLWRILRAQPELKPACILLVMSSMDILCLVFVLLNTCVEGTSAETKRRWLTKWGWSDDLFCKVTSYLVYLGSSFGVWAWITLSGQRFLSVVCPVFTHRHTKWVKSNARQLAILIAFCAVQQIWTFVCSEYKEGEGCIEATDVFAQEHYKTLLWLDTCFVFVVPVSATLIMEFQLRRFMDKQAYLTTRPQVTMTNTLRAHFELISAIHRASITDPQTSNNIKSVNVSNGSPLQEAVHSDQIVACTPVCTTRAQDPSVRNDKRLKRNLKMCKRLRRYLFLTSFDLALNVPYVLTRVFYGTFDGRTPASFTVECVLSSVAMVLYYAQYSLNILYIWVLYNKQLRKNSTHHTGRKPTMTKNYQTMTGTGTGEGTPTSIRLTKSSPTNAYGKASVTKVDQTHHEVQGAQLAYLPAVQEEEGSDSQVLL